MIPSWITQTPEAGVTADSFLKSVVFYRIHVGIQSPEGFSSSHGILRRFSDFLKLCSDVSWGAMLFQIFQVLSFVVSNIEHLKLAIFIFP